MCRLYPKKIPLFCRAPQPRRHENGGFVFKKAHDTPISRGQGSTMCPDNPTNTLNISRDVAINSIFTKDLDQYRKEIKSVGCPHCGKTGWLNCHGWLRGNGEVVGDGDGRRVRGARFFCCNRGRRQGCGKTFSAMLPANMPGFSVSARILGKFIAGARKGLSRKAAWEGLRSPYSVQTAYDLWNRLRRCQSTVHKGVAYTKGSVLYFDVFLF